MKAEYVYEMAIEALKGYCYTNSENAEKAQEMFDKALKDPYDVAALPGVGHMALLIEKAKEEITERGAKASGKAGVLRGMKKIIKVAEGGGRDALKGAWIDAEGYQVVCDGYRLARLKKPLDGLPESLGLDVANILKSAKDGSSREIALPTAGEIKAHIAEQKVLHREKHTGRGAVPVTYDLGKGLPMVTAQYLLDMLEIFPDATCTIKPGTVTGPMLFTSEAGEGILLPVYKASKANEVA